MSHTKGGSKHMSLEFKKKDEIKRPGSPEAGKKRQDKDKTRVKSSRSRRRSSSRSSSSRKQRSKSDDEKEKKSAQSTPRTWNFRKGSIDQLIEFLSNDADDDFVAHVLITFRYDVCALKNHRFFMSQRDFLLRLIRKFQSPPPIQVDKDGLTDWMTWMAPIRLRIFNILKAWVHMHFYDFEEDDVLFRSLINFMDTAMEDSDVANDLRLLLQDRSQVSLLPVLGHNCSFDVIAAALKKEVNGIVKDHVVNRKRVPRSVTGLALVEWLMQNLNLAQREEAVEIGKELLSESFLTNVGADPTAEFQSDDSVYAVSYEQHELDQFTFPEPIFAPANSAKLSFVDFNPREVARQLTLISHEIFKRATPLEFREFCRRKHAGKAESNHIDLLSALYTKTYYWTATEIVTTKDFNQRVRVLRKLIGLAAKLRLLQNFHVAAAVVNGLRLKAVSRLSRTWQALPPKSKTQFDDLAQLFSPEEDWSTYRREQMRLRSPVVPFLDPNLQDIGFIEGSHSDFADREGKLINFEKFRLLGRSMLVLRNMQLCNYRLVPLPQIQDYLSRVMVIDNDKALHGVSLTCESD